jgi:hypothetical protein
MAAKHRLARTISALMAIASIVAACDAGGRSPASVAATSGTTAPFVVPALTATFTSDLYGYTIRYPGFFDARAATTELRGAAAPLIDSDAVDQLNAQDGGVIVLGSGALPADTTLEEWTSSTATGFCGAPSTSESVDVGGEPGTLSTFASCASMFHQWVTAVHDGRGYHVIWAKDRGSEASDRALFLAMLATFAFGTDGEPSAESPGPSAAGLRPIEPGEPIPDSILGAWYNAAPAFLWILRAGDPTCLAIPRTGQDCAIWQPAGGGRLQTGILTLIGGKLSIQWTQGGCTTTTAYAFGDPTDRLTLRRVSGCESGDLVLIRAGSGSSPTAPPMPRS